VLSEILQRLDKVKQHGDQYYACCPVHDDKSPSMGITEKEGKVLIHCFSCGATGQEVMEAIGLPVSALFRDKKRGDIPNKIIEKAKEDVWYIEVFENEKRKGTRITYNEWKRYRLAKERVKILEER
tara:strand:+ start:1082 stop:1459 length:378 start_codon:yes stop_codon:yes gene_type:complete